MTQLVLIKDARRVVDQQPPRLDQSPDEPVVDALCRAAHREAPGVPVVLERWRGEWRADVRQVRRRA